MSRIERMRLSRRRLLAGSASAAAGVAALDGYLIEPGAGSPNYALLWKKA